MMMPHACDSLEQRPLTQVALQEMLTHHSGRPSSQQTTLRCLRTLNPSTKLPRKWRMPACTMCLNMAYHILLATLLGLRERGRRAVALILYLRLTRLFNLWKLLRPLHIFSFTKSMSFPIFSNPFSLCEPSTSSLRIVRDQRPFFSGEKSKQH